MSIENEASISHEQRGSALAGLDGGPRRLVASSGPAVCLPSAGVQPAWVLLRAASNPVLPGLVRPAVLPGNQRAPVLPGASVLPGSGADTDDCDRHPGYSGVLHGAGRGCSSEPASASGSRSDLRRSVRVPVLAEFDSSVLRSGAGQL